MNERNCTWFESHSKCARCNMGEDASVEHVVLECEKYERDRVEMMQVILTELEHGLDERVEKTGREWCCCWDCVERRMKGQLKL